MEFFEIVKKRNLITASLVLLGVVTSTATAEYIQFTFTGEVTEIGGALWDPWLDTQLGDPVTVQYIFDSNAEDQIPAGNIGYYFPQDLTVTVGDVTLDTSSSYANVVYDYITDATDYYLLGFYFVNGTVGSSFVTGIDLWAPLLIVLYGIFDPLGEGTPLF